LVGGTPNDRNHQQFRVDDFRVVGVGIDLFKSLVTTGENASKQHQYEA
jgi:hypothetical protein